MTAGSPVHGSPRWRLRLCFSKTGRLRFISHLDFIRAFERAVRRAGLPVSMSEGFSPAPRIAYGWPLPVGMAGLGEYLDMELKRRVPPEEVAGRLNRSLPEGLTVHDARYVTPHGPSLMSELDTGTYLVRVSAGGRSLGEWREAAARLLGRDRLEVTRERGGAGDGPVRAKVVDVRPLVRRLEAREVAGDEVVLYMELALTGHGVGRPEEVAALLWRELGLDPGAGPGQVSAVRLGLR